MLIGGDEFIRVDLQFVPRDRSACLSSQVEIMVKGKAQWCWPVSYGVRFCLEDVVVGYGISYGYVYCSWISFLQVGTVIRQTQNRFSVTAVARHS